MPRASLSDIAEDSQPQGRASLSDIADIAPSGAGKPPALRAPTKSESFTAGVSRTLGNLPASATNYMGGMVDKVLHPLNTVGEFGAIPVGIYEKLGGPTPEPWGRPGSRQSEKMLDATGHSLRNKYGSVSNAIDTLQTDPVGFASDASAVLGGVAGASKLGNLGRVSRYAEAASEAANPLIGPARGIAAVAKKAIPKEAMLDKATDLYQGALKVPPSWHRPGDLKTMINSAMDEGVKLDFVPSSGGALKQVGNKIEDINNRVKGTIQQGAATGKTVDPATVAQRTDRSRKAFTTVDPADVKHVDDVQQRFLGKYDQPIPVDEAQKLKQNTYRSLQDSAFDGQTPNAVKEAKKDLARGLKEEIYSHFPELQKLGQHERVLIDLQDALERFATRRGNHDEIALGTKALSSGNPLAAIATAAYDNPGVKSRIAIALRKAALNQKRPNTGALRQQINVAEAVNNAVQDQQQ